MTISDELVGLFLELDDECVTVLFDDGDVQDLKIVSISHVDLDGSVWGLPIDNLGHVIPTGPGISFNIEHVLEVREQASAKRLYPRDESEAAS